MRKIETYGNILKGKLHISYRDRFIQALSLMPDCRITLTVTRQYKKRSTPQNAYYWGVIIPIWQGIILDEHGESLNNDETHEFLKVNFNYVDAVNEATGEILRMPKSTTKNTTVQQEEYHERCRQAAASMFGVNIPLPNEQTKMFDI
jgi:hypothetical protein